MLFLYLKWQKKKKKQRKKGNILFSSYRNRVGVQNFTIDTRMLRVKQPRDIYSFPEILWCLESIEQLHLRTLVQ